MTQPAGTPGTEGETPSPAPPSAAEGLLAEVASLVRRVAADGDRDISEVVAFLHSHGI